MKFLKGDYVMYRHLPKVITEKSLKENFNEYQELIEKQMEEFGIENSSDDKTSGNRWEQFNLPTYNIHLTSS